MKTLPRLVDIGFGKDMSDDHKRAVNGYLLMEDAYRSCVRVLRNLEKLLDTEHCCGGRVADGEDVIESLEMQLGWLDGQTDKIASRFKQNDIKPIMDNMHFGHDYLTLGMIEKIGC